MVQPMVEYTVKEARQRPIPAMPIVRNLSNGVYKHNVNPVNEN